MSIKRGGQTIVFVCDECGNEHDTGISREGDFQEAVDDMKRFKWRSQKDPETNAWEHRCNVCR